MIAHIRFGLHKNGNYVEYRIRIPEANVVQQAEIIHAFCMGYELASGNRATLIALDSAFSLGDPNAHIIHDMERKALKALHEQIEKLKRDIPL